MIFTFLLDNLTSTDQINSNSVLTFKLMSLLLKILKVARMG